MALTVAEVRTLFTADTRDYERGVQAVQRSTRDAAAQIASTMRRAGTDGGAQFASGVDGRLRGMDRTFGTQGALAGRSYGAGVGRTAGAELRTQLTRSVAGIGLGALAVQGFGKTITLAKDFDLTMRQVGVQTGQTGKQVDQLRQLALKMGSDTVFSANDAGDAMLELAKGGMSAAEVKAGALQSAMLLAAAGQISMGDAATYTVQGMTTFGLKASEAEQVAVALSGGALASTASVQSLGEALSQVGPGAKTAGLSLQETVAALAAFDNAGIKGSDAGTSLKTFLASLVPTTKQAKDAMDSYGLSFVNADGSMKSLAQMSEQLHDRLGGLSAAQKTAALNTIFGSDAARAASVLMGLGADGVRKYEKATRDSTAAQKLAKTGTEGFSGALEQFQGSVDTLAIKTGTKLLPSLTKGAKKAGEFIDEMSSGKGAGGDFADALGTVADTVGDISKGVGKVVGWWGKMPGSVQGAILKTGVYAGAIGGVLVTAKKLADVMGTVKGGAGVLTRGRIGGPAGGFGGGRESVGTMTVRAGVVNITGGKGVGGGRGGPTVLPQDGGKDKRGTTVVGGGSGGDREPRRTRPRLPSAGRAVATGAAGLAAYAGLDYAADHVKNKTAQQALRGRTASWALTGAGVGSFAGPAGGVLGGLGGALFGAARDARDQRNDPRLQRGRASASSPLGSVAGRASQVLTGGAAASGGGAAASVGAQVEAARKALSMLPKEVATKITAPGAKLTTQDVVALAKEYDLTPAEVKTLMQATGVDEGRAKVSGYLSQLGLTPEQVQTVLNADTTAGTGKLQAYLRRLGLTPKQVKTVVSALTSGAQGDISSVLKRLGIVDRTHATATASVRADLSGFYTVQAALNRLPSRVTTVAQVKNGLNSARGNYLPEVRRYALGGGDVANGHQPEIAQGGAPHRVWAEPETGGEAYIPLRNDGRRARAKELLAQVAGRFGGTVAFAQGGTTGVGSLPLGSMSGLDFSKLTRAWLEAAQATSKAAQETTTSRLADVQAQKQIADLYVQLKGAKGLDRTATLLELQKAKEDLGALRAQGTARLLSDQGTAARDKAIDRAGIFGTSATTASQLYRNLAADVVTNDQFAGIVAQLTKAGLSKSLLDQFTAQGPSSQSLALGKSILATGNIAQLNSVQTALSTQALQAGYQAQGAKAPGADGRLVNIQEYYEAGKSVNEIAEELYFKSQMRTG